MSDKNVPSFGSRVPIFLGARFSEAPLLSGVCAVGAIVLIVHLSTWGRDVWLDSKRPRPIVCQVVEVAANAKERRSGAVDYRPEVKIRYEFGGETYEVWAYDRSTFDPNSGFDYAKEEAEKALAPFGVGSSFRCWIRDDDPSRAILVRKSTFWGWVFLFIPVSLILFGFGWLVALIFERTRSKEARATLRREEKTFPNIPTLELEKGAALAKRLRVDVKSSLGFRAAAFGTIVWNLASWATSVYVFAVAKSSADLWAAWAFAAVFCGVGFLFICRAWGLRRIERVVGSIAVETSACPVSPGRNVTVCVLISGRVVAKRMDVFVKCEEIARYVQGTNSIRWRKEIYSKLLFTRYGLDVAKKKERREFFTFSLPPGIAPSFEAEHNEISWKLVVQLEFADGGTFSRDFGLVVLPFQGGKYTELYSRSEKARQLPDD